MTVRTIGQGGALLVALLVMLWAPAAFAHASLIGSDPVDGAVLDGAPQSFVLRFNETVRPIIGRLTLPDQTTIMLDTPPTGAEVTFTLPEVQAQGSYLLSWRVTSGDGHPAAGGTLFSVGHASETGAVETRAPRSTRTILWILRSLLLSGLLFGVAGIAFAHFAATPAPHAARIAIGIALVALPLTGLFQALDILGQGPGALLTRAPWAEVLRGPPALALVLAALSLVLARWAVLRPGLVLPALALMAGAVATTGHAATAAPQLLMRPAVALHVLAAGFWLGAFLPLIAALQGGQASRALHRFGALIPWALVVLLASGAALSVVQLEQVQALWTTAYGRVLMAKLALVAGLLGLGLYNRARLTARAEAGDSLPLIRAIRAELVLAVLVIAALGLWRFTPPPRNIPPAATVIQQHIGNERVSARLDLGANRAGPVSVALSRITLDGRPLSPKETRVEFSKPAFGLGPFSRTAPTAAGRVDAGTFVLPMDGFWVLRVTFLIEDFRSEEVMDIVTLEPLP